MKKNLILIVILSMLILLFSSCQKKQVEKVYTVTWKNYDGTTLEIDENVEYGTLPTFDGNAPTKAADEKYSYTFSGWDKEITTVTKDVTYTAQFSSTINSYTVTWKNYDGTTLEIDENVEYGTLPTFDGFTPTKAADAKYSYTFSGWDKEITTVTGDVTYTAQFSSTINSYIVTWKNYDGTTLEIDENVEYGTLPTFDGNAPTKAADAKYSYTFSGWDKEITTVTGDVTYTAQFSSTINSYIVIWKNYDGTTLEIDENVEYGTLPTFDGFTPTKAADAKYSYKFSGWDKEITTVTGDVTYTAQFSSTLNLYNLSISSNDSSKGTTTIVSGSGYYGETITVVANPVENCSFQGWYNGEIKVSDEATYTFTMTGEDYSLVAYFVSNYDEKEIWDIAHGIIPHLSSDGKTITYGLYPQTRVTDSTLLASLNALTTPSTNGWYMFENEYYVKTNANPYNSSVNFSDGTTIVSGATYWFKCEPITWNILENNNGEYYLLSSVILDARCYYNSTSYRTIDDVNIYANNYEYSDIRSWLNADFYNMAFGLDSSYIQITLVDNSADTTCTSSNDYACGNTNDKVFLPSYKDLINSEYGFYSKNAKSETRCCELTDWARVRGAFNSTDSTNMGNYWTRSPYNTISSGAYYVNTIGIVSSHYVSTTYIGVRPGISLKIS